MDALIRLLEVIARELQAADVRLEVGLREPRAEDLWCPVSGAFRVVASFDLPVLDRADKQQRLEGLVSTFVQTFEQAGGEIVEVGRHAEATSLSLDQTLEVLVHNAGAIAAAVIDEASPMLWGTSVWPRGAEDVDFATALAVAATAAERGGLALEDLLGLETDVLDGALVPLPAEDRARVGRLVDRVHRNGPHRQVGEWRPFVAVMRAVAAARHTGTDGPTGLVSGQAGPWAWVAQGFNGIYRLVLALPQPYSQLHAHAAVHRALPVIENLVAALPPMDPGPGPGRRKGQVVRLFPTDH